MKIQVIWDYNTPLIVNGYQCFEGTTNFQNFYNFVQVDETDPGAHPSSCTMGTESPSQG